MSRPSGFELRPVDRLMRRRHAPSCGAALAGVIGAGLLLAVSPSVHTPRELWQMLLHRAGIFAMFGGLFAVGGWWTVHTWKALWRRGRSSRERVIYDMGVRGMGFIMGVVIFLVVTWLGLTADAKMSPCRKPRSLGCRCVSPRAGSQKSEDRDGVETEHQGEAF